MLKWILVLWPSFLVAGIAEIVFFAIVNPQQLYFLGDAVDYPPLATYSIGFLGFWAVCAGSSLLTLFLQRNGGDLNAAND